MMESALATRLPLSVGSCFLTLAVSTNGLRRLALSLAIATRVLGTQFAGEAAIGGPVILWGDDLTDHGCSDSPGGPMTSPGNLVEGWPHIERALENIKPHVVRTNDNSIAALGSAATTTVECGNAGSAIGVAGPKAGMTVTYYNGAMAINGFFDDLSAGRVSPRIIWIAGNQAANDLDSSEERALTPNAAGIANFVNSGGGLMSHGTYYGWLQTLLPGLQNINSGGPANDLQLTAAGQAAFPAVTDADVGTGPWHNHFEGHFGEFQVLVNSKTVMDSYDNSAAVAIGGAAVVLPGSIAPTPATASNAPGTTHTAEKDDVPTGAHDDGTASSSSQLAALAPGSPCSDPSECSRGFCVDGFCCNRSCGGGGEDCLGCSNALTGLPDGRCGVVNSGVVCRVSRDICDVGEVCDGVKHWCPGDVLLPSGLPCRGAADLCDVEETCTGMDVACPADGVRAAGTPCRAAAGPCDQSDICDGSSKACTDAFKPSGFICNSAVTDICDAPDRCTGGSVDCPPVYLSGVVCRLANGPCDIPEVCAGTAQTCPPDLVLSAEIVCRASSNTSCDPAESCDGIASSCPSDVTSCP